MPSLNDIITSSPVHIYPDRYTVIQCSSLPNADAFMVTNDGQEITAIVKASNLDTIEYTGIEQWFILYGIDISVPFEGPGFLARIAGQLGQSGINVLIVSTFSRYFLLLREDDADAGTDILRGMGFAILE